MCEIYQISCTLDRRTGFASFIIFLYQNEKNDNSFDTLFHFERKKKSLYFAECQKRETKIQYESHTAGKE